ncbi:MAG: cyclase family protein [Gammaproteobacteria bacterium]|nr:cyclase family protein [Gammaproteobacteria bacterium]
MIEIDWHGRRYRSDAPVASDLAIPLSFDGRGPRVFGAAAAGSTPLATEHFSARVADGASCNASTLRIAPHGNGTHTETVAHLCESGPDAPSLLAGGWMPAWLASVEIGASAAIAPDSLTEALACVENTGAIALVLRTVPNDMGKLRRDYDRGAPPGRLSTAAAQLVADSRIEHLIVDLPSLDRLDDPELPAHRAFFGLPPGSRNLRDAKRRHATITEMIFAADELADGLYLLDLQMPRWRLEAVPSRPLVVPAKQWETNA